METFSHTILDQMALSCPNQQYLQSKYSLLHNESVLPFKYLYNTCFLPRLAFWHSFHTGTYINKTYTSSNFHCNDTKLHLNSRTSIVLCYFSQKLFGSLLIRPYMHFNCYSTSQTHFQLCWYNSPDCLCGTLKHPIVLCRAENIKNNSLPTCDVHKFIYQLGDSQLI